MIVYFEYGQILTEEESQTMEPVERRDLLTEIAGDITMESKSTAGLHPDIAQKKIDAIAILDALGKPYYIRLHFHNHPQQSCEIEAL